MSLPGPPRIASYPARPEIVSSPARVLIISIPVVPSIESAPVVPLKNEVVYIMSLPNSNVQGNVNETSFYYFKPINIWNSVLSIKSLY